MPYHHYKGNLPRSEFIQRLVVERIINSPIEDEGRESSKVWELKHCSSCVQVGRILALKRGLDVALVEVMCALHDIYVIDTGKYENHAVKGAEIARNILHETKRFTEDEIAIICTAIRDHSDKGIQSDNAYVEIIKDADVYDCSLYPGTADYYREFKSDDALNAYFRRARDVSVELGVPLHPSFVL